MTSKPRHLHPLAMVVNAIQIFWGVVVLIFLDIATDTDSRMTVVNGAEHWLVWVVLGVVALLGLLVVLPYWLTTYELTDRGVTLNRGVFRRQHLHVTYARIQTVQHLQWFFAKPFGVERVQIETAARGNGHGEVVLTLVPVSVGREIEERQRAARMQSSVDADDQADATTTRPASSVTTATTVTSTYRLPVDELVIFGITSLGFIPLLFVLFAAWSQVSDWFPGVVDWLAHILRRLPIVGLIALVIMTVAVGVIAEFVRILLRYWGFTLDFDGQRLQSRKGLLQTNTVTATARRIQAVRYKQNVIRQWFHVGTAQVILASNVASKEDDKDMVIYPLARANGVWRQLSHYVNWLPASMPSLTMVTTGRWAMMRNAMILPLIVVLPALVWLRPWGWLSLLLLLWGYVQGRYAASRRGYTTQGGYIYLQTGRWFERELLVAPRARVQSLTVRQSWWMVRTGLAHVRVSLRRGDGQYVVQLRYVPLAAAETLYQWYTGNRVPVAGDVLAE